MRTWLLVLALLLPTTAAAQDAKEFRQQADDAYGRKEYAASVTLYDKAIAAGDKSSGVYYNAACSASLSGAVDAAFQYLSAAVESGDGNDINGDSDLASLRNDPRWAALVARQIELHPEAPYWALLSDWKLSAAARYFPVRSALSNGLVAPARPGSPFLEFYATVASWVGEYDEASARFRLPLPTAFDPVLKGFVRAVPANAVILQRAKGRQAVFLNESHFEAQTRAATFTLLEPLRKEGFAYLALETLVVPEPRPAGATACDAPKLGDIALPSRGYPVNDTGLYTREPVYGEIIREALRLGYSLVSYEGPGNGAPRLQHQAEMIACVFKADPKARVLVIAGFGNMSESEKSFYGGGAMGYRFKQLTGIDPLTVDNATLLSADPRSLSFPADDTRRSAQSYVLFDDHGKVYGDDRFDMMVYVRQPAHRGDVGGSWLELDGARVATPVASTLCKQRFPCLVEARGIAEGSDAIPNDRCVIAAAGETGCTLYLRPGKYTVVTRNDKDEPLDSFGQDAVRPGR